MKLKTVLLEKPMRLPKTTAEAYADGGVASKELRGDRYELVYDPATQLISVTAHGVTKLIHVSRVESMEAAPDREPAKMHWKTRRKLEREAIGDGPRSV